MEAHSTVDILSEVDEQPLSEEQSDARWAAHAARRRARNHALQLHLQARCRVHAAEVLQEESEHSALERQLSICQERIAQARASYERAGADQARVLQHHSSLLEALSRMHRQVKEVNRCVDAEENKMTFSSNDGRNNLRATVERVATLRCDATYISAAHALVCLGIAKPSASPPGERGASNAGNAGAPAPSTDHAA